MLQIEFKTELPGHDCEVAYCLFAPYTDPAPADFEFRVEDLRDGRNNIYGGCGFSVFYVAYLRTSVFVGKLGGNLR